MTPTNSLVNSFGQDLTELQTTLKNDQNVFLERNRIFNSQKFSNKKRLINLAF